LSLIYNLGLAYLKAVVHVRPGAKSLKHSEPSHLNLLVQGNQVYSGIHGGFFIFRYPVSTPEANITDPIICTEAAYMPQDSGQILAHSKRTLRRELRARRGELSKKLRTRHDQAICQHLEKLVKSHGAGSIACYWPFDGEPDITPVYRRLLAEGCELVLPVISGDDKHGMHFHSWRDDTGMGKNRYGIVEPMKTGAVPLSSLDMLLMPLVGYDRLGNRLGMGAGYYDRCLESLRDLPTPLRVGIAYSLQEVDPVEKNKWDIPLHGLVNEHGWFTFVGEEPLTRFKED
jgi:5-formyltetrahydrofolate cyclo-ligase